MNDQELLALYNDLLNKLRVDAPWVAEQIEETIREGKPVARQVKRAKGGIETVAVVVASSKLRDDQFAATEELTLREIALVALHAIERFLIDPHEIERTTRDTLMGIGVEEVLFADPTTENVTRTEPVRLKFDDRTRLIELLGRVKREVSRVG
jgi:hypothetical protein